MPSWAAGTRPVITTAVATYSTVQTISDPMMPRGKLRCGSRVSSAAVETASKPMYEKNASEAPVQMPAKPLGANGV